MNLDRFKKLALRWVVPLSTLTALISVWVLGLATNVIAANAVVVVNALLVAKWFMDRRDGFPAIYGVRVDPEDQGEDVDLLDWLMVCNASLTVLAPFCLILHDAL
ncbi:MAG TPA: hypothetical protein VNS57_17935 [Steroidobacteraceae bacterium]|nr:hypothetical protein [Steroidobacteraceae bacterium]